MTVLPATDLYLMGRDRDHAVLRGVADANHLAENGVTCSLSSNNILNPATPYGDCSLIRIANLHANVLQMVGARELRELFLMLSEHSARLLNLNDYGLAGQPGRSRRDRRDEPGAGGRRDPPAARVWKRGRRTVTRQPPELQAPV